MGLKDLKESLLPQPPSFSKKKSYVLHQVLGTGTFGKVIHATWTPPKGSQLPITALSAAALVAKQQAQPDAASVARASTSSTSKSNFTITSGGSGSSGTASVITSSGTVVPVKLDVALKVITKKKVKGNEHAVWGEMEVLRGLDHPNIVRGIFF